MATPIARALPPPASEEGPGLPPAVAAALARGIGRVSRPAVELQRDIAGDKAASRGAVGTYWLPVLMGDFPDRPGTQAAATLAAALFGTWPSGSLRDYFNRVSYGRLQVVGAVDGWYRVGHDAATYEGSSNGLDIFADVHAGTFVREVVAQADAMGFDWGNYDNDGPDGIPNSGDDDGYVDVVVVVHAGRGGECGANPYLWSHSYYLAGWGEGTYVTRTPRTGRPGEFLRVDDYTLQPELSCELPAQMIEIGVFCHEFGHALGLPDLYDTGTDPQGRGIGVWGLMGHGCWGGDGASPEKPVAPSAWSRAFLGWLEPEVVTSDRVTTVLASAFDDGVLKVWSDGEPGSEYFLIENRQRLLDDALLPGAGLLIWHIDEAIIDENLVLNYVNAGSIYGVALEQADGDENLHGGSYLNRGDSGDPWPGYANARSFTNATVPSSRANHGDATSVSVTEISASGISMTARVEVGVPATTAAPSSGPALHVGACTPNPCNPRTVVAFHLQQPGRVVAGVYDLRGRRVRTLLDAERAAGRGEVVWDGRDGAGRAVPSGVYFLQLISGPTRATRKVVLAR